MGIRFESIAIACIDVTISGCRPGFGQTNEVVVGPAQLHRTFPAR